MYLRTRVSVYSCISVLVYQRTYNIGSAEYYRTGVVGECITNILISIDIYIYIHRSLVCQKNTTVLM